jgi:RNA polymerase sigma factor for flagellar operon FliA
MNKQERDKMIEDNMPLVTFVAKKFKTYNHIHDFEDLLQIGYIGLINAVDKYDESKGTKFSTYAHMAITNTIVNQFKRNDVRSVTDTVTLETPICEDGNITLNEAIVDDYDAFTDLENKEFIKQLYTVLSKDEKLLLNMRYVNDMKIEDIGNIMAMSQPTTSRAIQKVIQKIQVSNYKAIKELRY